MNKNANVFDLLAKALIIGDSGVGKSCLFLRFCENNFTATHLATIGIDFKMKTIEVEGKKVKLQTWDTAGQERFKTITQTFYRGAMGIILTYAVNDRASFANIESWMRQIKHHADDDVCKILVGNKCDVEDRCVDYEEGKRLADSYGIQFFETSAKDAKNVNDAFYAIAAEMVQKAESKVSNAGKNGSFKHTGGKLNLESNTNKSNKFANCCQ